MIRVPRQRTHTFLAVGLLTLSLFGVAGTAHAAIASSRFATYTAGGDGVSATVNPPAGYPAGNLTATLASSVSVSSSLTMRNSTTSFQTFFQADGVTPSTVPSYLSLRSRGNTVTLTFSDPIPANSVAINVVDVDVERLTFSATGPGNSPLTASQLGFREVYNGIGSHTDTPVWDPTTATLTGSGVDTNGAASWFSPTVEIESLTLTSPIENNMTGSSVIYLWLAAIRPVAVVTPTVTTTEISSPSVSFPLAVSTSGGALTHTVDNVGTAGCALTDTSLSVTNEGVCTVTVTSAETPHYRSGSATFTFTVTADQPGDIDPVAPLITPTITTTTLDVPEVPLPLATATGGGVITHTVVDSGTAGCALGDTELVVSAVGTCTIQAIAAPTATYLSGATTFTFTVTASVQDPDSTSSGVSDNTASTETTEGLSPALAATGPEAFPWWSNAVLGAAVAVVVTTQVIRRTTPR